MKLTSLVIVYYILLARSFVVILGCIAVWWGIVGFPIFWQDSSIELIANRVIANEPFKVAILTRQLPIINKIETSADCRSAALRSAAIIRLRMVEAAASANDSDKHMNSLGNVIRSSLSCSPADPFLWLALYWVEGTKNGFGSNYFRYLRMSYQLGPNEAWIALKRNRVSIAQLEQLPPDLTEAAIHEFLALTVYDEAVAIFTNASLSVQDQLLRRLKDVSAGRRLGFLSNLQDSGYEIDVPGYERSNPNWRPWR
jgi:hypothetical protein